MLNLLCFNLIVFSNHLFIVNYYPNIAILNLISDSAALFNHVERNICDPQGFVLEFKAKRRALLENLYVARFSQNPRGRTREEL